MHVLRLTEGFARKKEGGRKCPRRNYPDPGCAIGDAELQWPSPGETEAGTAGMQPCQGIAWWAHRDDDRQRGNQFLALLSNLIGSKDPDALKIPARRAEYSLTESASSPVQAEPRQKSNAQICCWRTEGALSLTEILFDKSRTRALVGFGVGCGMQCGWGDGAR